MAEVIALGDVVREEYQCWGSDRDGREDLGKELVCDFLQTILQRFRIECYLFTISFKMEFRDDLCDHVSHIADTFLAM